MGGPHLDAALDDRLMRSSGEPRSLEDCPPGEGWGAVGRAKPQETPPAGPTTCVSKW